MSHNAATCPPQVQIRASRPTLRSAILTFVLALSIFSVATQAQTIDCYASLEAYKLSNPELHCTCASASSTPSCGGSSTTHSSHTLTTKQMMQQAVAETVVSAFVNMLFSNDSQANAQKQKMMAELQARQQAAARQKQYEEAIRLAAICQRLEATLKLSNTPALKPKTDAANVGLQLKTGDGSGAHIGVPGLPGIALNDNTGNGGSTPYGIQGLPGIYTNGPATPAVTTSGRQHSSAGGLALKLGEDPSTGQTPAPTAQTSNVAQNVAIPDPRTMTPQQLADMATNLSPEQQQQLANALQAAQTPAANPTVNGASGQSIHLSPTSTVTAAPEPSTTDASVSQSGGLAASVPAMPTPGQLNSTSSPALGQLQQTAVASQAAAKAKTLEDAAAGARVGFDQSAGAVSAAGNRGGGVTPQVAQGGAQAGNSQMNTSNVNPMPGTKHSSPVVDISVLKPPPTIATSSTSSHSLPAQKQQCIPRTEHQLPSRQELLTELAQRRTELERLRATILRLNRSIQMDQKQFEMWQAEAEAGHERVVNRVFSLPTKLALDSFIDLKEAQFAEKKAKGLLTALDRKEMGMLERAKDLKTFDDFQRWVLEEKSENETFEEGIRQIIGTFSFTPQVKSYINCAQDLIDNAYDLVDLANTWDNVQQLDHNSDRFLLGVKGNGERMKSLVTRIQQIELQLNGTPRDVQIQYCPPVVRNQP